MLAAEGEQMAQADLGNGTARFPPLVLGGLTALLVMTVCLLPSIIYAHANHIDLLHPGASAGPPPASAQPQGQPAAPAQVSVTRWKDVQPIFADHCLGCHSSLGAYSQALKPGAIPMAGLLAGVRVIIPGDLAGSILYQAIDGQPSIGDTMPYREGRLSNAEIKTIAAWIQSGAQP